LNIDKPLKIKADRLHLANAINNLIDNAIKYSNDDLQISIKCLENTDSIEIRVSDNGHGISKEYLPEIFTPFFRVPQGNLHDVKGFGLGLSYVKKVIEAHKGKVSVSSKLNEGSTFTLAVPK
jgi:signal transduction histidine kinase